MALTQLLQYGIYYIPGTEVAAAAAITANGNSLIYNLSPEAAIAVDPNNIGLLLAYNTPPLLNNLPGTVTLGYYTPVFGTPGVTYSPNTVSTGTLTTAVTRVTYGSFSNVMETDTVNFTWQGVIVTTQGIASGGGFLANPYYFVGAPTAGPPPAFTGSWDQQVVTWTGDGTSGRLIPTTFSLASGVVSIWIFGDSTTPVFRHTAMNGTTGVLEPDDTAAGIMSFVSGGFTVKDGSNTKVNTLGISYTAIVLRDSTSDNRYMKVGQYVGAGAQIVTIGGSRQITQLWIFGRGGTGSFCSDDFNPGNSLSWPNEGISLTTQITALGTGAFTVGNSSNTGNNGQTYYYIAFSIPASTPPSDPIRNHFQTYKTTGTGSPVVVPLNFSPTFVIGACFNFASENTTWRGPLQAGTHSDSYTGVNFASGGIEALGVNSTTIGTTTATNTKDVYGFALKSAHVQGPVVVYSPPPVPSPFSPGVVLPYVIGGGYSIQWLLERFELKSRQEEHL